jgi:phosphate transport system substrate-binding protein
VLVSYSLACTTYEDPKKGEVVKAFLSYIASERARTRGEAAGSAPISAALRSEVEASIEKIGAAPSLTPGSWVRAATCTVAARTARTS